MPVITFKVADVLRAKIMDKGWNSYRVASINAEASKDKQSVNYVTIFTLIDKGPDLDGKEIKQYFNSKAIATMIPLVAAVKGIRASDIKPEAFEVDTDLLVGASIDGNTDVDTYEGQMKNIITDFAPYKSIVGKPSAF